MLKNWIQFGKLVFVETKMKMNFASIQKPTGPDKTNCIVFGLSYQLKFAHP